MKQAWEVEAVGFHNDDGKVRPLYSLTGRGAKLAGHRFTPIVKWMARFR